MFEIEKTAQQVRQVLVNVPSEHKMAFVTVANKDGVKAAFVTKINDEWQIQTYGQYILEDHKLDYGVIVQWSK